MKKIKEVDFNGEHIWPNGSKGGVTRAEVRPGIDRIAFDKWKRDYWKARAKELGEH